MKKIVLAGALFFHFLSFSQTFVQAYQDRAVLVSQSNIHTYLQEFAALGIKKTGTQANANALAWLKAKYQSFGYSETQIQEDPFSFGGTSSKNLIITKTGTLYPDQYVIICGHYDSINGPGVNDNGSGVSVIMEAARILNSIPTDYSIRFIHFSGEEQGLYGSSHYVENVVNATQPKMKIKLVLNIDEVGGISGTTNNTITCERDTSSPTSNNAASAAATQELMNCVALYSPLNTHLAHAYASDYMPFQSNNEVITGLFEYNESPYRHTPNDTYANMDPVYVYNIAKATVGAIQHFSGASTETLSACPSAKMLQTLKIYPNPAQDIIHISMLNSELRDYTFELYDSSGTLISKTKNAKQIRISHLKPGVYLGTVEVDGQKQTEKVIIK